MQESQSSQPVADGQERPSQSPGAGFWSDLRTAPNIISLARIVLIYVGIGLWYEGHFALGLGIGVLAGLSDYLDGYLARRLKLTTRIGGLLDQAADALFMTGCIFVFVRDGTWPAILLFVVLFREIFVLNLRASAAEMGFSLPSVFLGKLASNFMFYALALMAAHRGDLFPGFLDLAATWLAHFGMAAGAAMSVITGVLYFRSYARQYRPAPRQ